MNHETSGNYQCAAMRQITEKVWKITDRVLAHFEAHLLKILEYSSLFS